MIYAMTTPRPKRSRLRRIAKWTGLVVCVVIVGVWGVSLRWCMIRFGTYVRRAELRNGLVIAAWRTDSQLRQARATRWEVSVVSPSRARYGFIRPIAERVPSLKFSYVSLPLWLPLLVFAIPTAILWHRDRRRSPPGHCQQCGYDLTGNESGVCPECGVPCQAKAGGE